jgi:Flp pilus assembly protein TadD
MKRYSALTVIIASLVCISQVAQAQGKKEGSKGQPANEANRFAREGAEASKNQDWDKAVDLLRKATSLDHKYAPDLAIAYQGRGYAFAKNQQFQEAVQDYTEALKIKSNDPRIYEQRAAVEMKMYDYDKALADYSELIKLKPNDVRYLNYRAYVYEVRENLKDSMADTEQVLKLDSNNQEAKARKQRLEQKQAAAEPLTPPPAALRKSSPGPSRTP